MDEPGPHAEHDESNDARAADAAGARRTATRGAARNKVHWIYSITENMYGRRVPVE